MIKEEEIPLESAPLWLFDSFEIQQLHFFTKADGYLFGLGVARKWPDSAETFQKDFNQLNFENQRNSEKLWIFGGLGFPPVTSSRMSRPRKQSWKDFPNSEWIIPALTIVSEKGKCRIILAVDKANESEAKLTNYYETLAKVLLDGPQKNVRQTMPNIKRIQNIPSQKQWKRLVSHALKSISDSGLQKVVLARSLKVSFDSQITISPILSKLIEEQSNPCTSIFAIKKDSSVFVGATPEKLLSLNGGNLKVDCLAASAPRGTDKAQDDLLGQNLLRDKKSLYEHRIVVDRVTKSLSKICADVGVSDITPTLRKLPNVQHLFSEATGKIQKEMDIWSAAKTLWPTPATCGEPRETALKWIERFERGIERGWYSGLVGYVSAPESSGILYVSIRSAVIKGNQAVLYAGNGIVPGSEPEKEFQETGWKMKTILNALVQSRPESDR